MATDRKSWAGTTMEERRAGRRAQLLEAALEIASTAGAAAVSVRAVCRKSGLTERYFYESFETRETLLVALQGEVATGALGAVATAAATVAEQAGGPLSMLDLAETTAATAAVVHAFTDHVLEDPRRARILLVESFADPTLTQLGLESVPQFAALIATAFSERWPEAVDETDARLSGQAAMGGLIHLYLGWLRGELEVDRDRLERHAVALLMAAGPLSSRGSNLGSSRPARSAHAADPRV